MSYDPRHGSSPYLGMDAGWDEAEEGRGDVRPQPAAEPRSAVRSHAPADVPPTVLRPQRPAATPAPAPMPAASPFADDRPLRRPRPAPAPDAFAYPAPAPRPVPSPQQRSYQPPLDSYSPAGVGLPRPLRLLASLSLWALALCLRLGATALSALVVASAVLTSTYRATLIEALRVTDVLVPAPILGQFVYETPFGGAFRGDLALAAIILFCADWICMRFSTSLRERRERGA